MRFGLINYSDEDEEEEDDEITHEAYDYSSDELETLTRIRTRPASPRSQLGRSIKAAFDISDEEDVDVGVEDLLDLDSEDEVDGFDLESSSGWGKEAVSTKYGIAKGHVWRERAVLHSKNIPSRPKPTKKVSFKGQTKSILKFNITAERDLNQPGPSDWARRTGEPSLREILSEAPSEFEGWIKQTEGEAWREGQKMSQARRGQLREIKMNARIEIQNERARKSAKETEEIQRLLKGLVMRHEDDERRRKSEFAERERQLWADIDAAIAETNRKAEQARATALAVERKQKEEEANRIALAEKQVQSKRLEAERALKAKSEKDRADREALAAAERAKALAEEEEAAKLKEAESGTLTRTEWGRWVERQKWMKKEVIEVVKADKTLRAGLKVGMRLITRGLGQVVNTKESVMRVTDDIHNILNSQLPQPPSITQPTLLTQPPPTAYTYLLSHLSKALIKQAESEVNAKADAAFPLARIVVGLLLRGHAALGEVLFARFVKKAPWVIPFYPGRLQGQSREEYEKSTGRGTDESVAEYISRQAGIVTLYFAILQTPLSSLIAHLTSPNQTQLSVLIPQPLRLPQAWSWISNILKDPLPSISPSAHLIAVWMEIVGAQVCQTYGVRQTGKIVEVIGREGLSVSGSGNENASGAGQGGESGGVTRIKGDSEAARQRLRLAVDGWMREGPKFHPARDWK